jgi:hypothetical protein
MLRHSRPAYGHAMSKLAHRHRPTGKALEYRSSGAIGESRPCIGGFVSDHER